MVGQGPASAMADPRVIAVRVVFADPSVAEVLH